MKELMELMRKKGASKMSPERKEAKMSVLGDLKKMTSSRMADDLKGLKKVTVAASDDEGLKEGLEKAEDVVEQMPEMAEASEEEEDSMLAEGSEKEMSLEDIEARIAELEALKEKMLG